ncbi:unnamed protein product [Arabidopsis lyrata]|uniref:Cystatin domain-containing protein n=1 Tax=Arabidopsis lyrata subsp. lyrata TaxID=81972 RepID=D7M2L9_ARALL|nr:death domain-associated protein 6 [Arabidopsis lyrata subsp. lyrata]EFH51115.1 hypothetical protein ARALYDRAFT_490205 [Arabidopsis lyrata subsp. lyrata]CAH8273283.1 unnamed protein product [Arabidopsis lyrata]|eukprot:XP_002874856.1 death domain-associated protein 6 [Arabidopsis lyrata subsp. lyrata]
MASGSSKTKAQTAQIASTAAEPIETTTDESTVSSSLNKDRSDSETKDDDYSAESDEEEEGEDYESNGEEEEDDDDKESDGEDDVDSIVDDGDSTSDQPEWGVDDFDDIYSDFYSPDEDCYTDEEDERKKRLYRRNLHFSHGFLVEKGIRPRSVWSGAILLEPLDSEHSPVKGRTQLQYAQDMAKLCLCKYNALNETNVTLDHVVRVTGSFTGSWVSYITFMAKESEDDDTLVEYQAKVVKKLKCKTYPMFCRPSPKLDPDM